MNVSRVMWFGESKVTGDKKRPPARARAPGRSGGMRAPSRLQSLETAARSLSSAFDCIFYIQSQFSINGCIQRDFTVTAGVFYHSMEFTFKVAEPADSVRMQISCEG
jgi:hypothetical protein